MRKIVTTNGNYQDQIVPQTFLDNAIRQDTLVKTLINENVDELYHSNNLFGVSEKANYMKEDFRIIYDKRTKETINEGDMKFKALAESASFPIMIFQDDYWVFVNAAARKAFGYSTDEFYKNHFWTFFGDSFNYDLVQNGKSRQNSKQPDSSYECKIRCKSGAFKFIGLKVSSIMYKDKPAGIISMRDITEHKRTQELQKVIFTISNAAINAPDTKSLIKTIIQQISLVIDTQHVKIECYDRNFCLLSSAPNEEMNKFVVPWPSRKSLLGYMINQNRAMLLSKDQISKLMEGGEIDVEEINCESLLGVPLYNGDKIIGSFYAKSIDQVKAFTEEDLEMMIFIAAQISNSIQKDHHKHNYRKVLLKAEESERLKVAFLSNISHAIRTPMNAIVGFSELIENEDISVHERDDFGSIISQSVMSLLSTVNDIIDVSEIHCNQLEINKKWFNLNDLLDQLLDLFNNEKTIKGKADLTILLEKGFDDHLSMMCSDAHSIHKILYCLLDNALIYTKIGIIKFGYVVRNDELCFYVKDTGKGIAKEKQEIIFQSFRQEDETPTRAFDGVGLGLTISKGLVGLLGGQIWLDSKEGEGSVFSFSFPFENQTCKYPHCTGTQCEHPNMQNNSPKL